MRRLCLLALLRIEHIAWPAFDSMYMYIRILICSRGCVGAMNRKAYSLLLNMAPWKGIFSLARLINFHSINLKDSLGDPQRLSNSSFGQFRKRQYQGSACQGPAPGD